MSLATIIEELRAVNVSIGKMEAECAVHAKALLDTWGGYRKELDALRKQRSDLHHNAWEALNAEAGTPPSNSALDQVERVLAHTGLGR